MEIFWYNKVNGKLIGDKKKKQWLKIKTIADMFCVYKQKLEQDYF
jgi:hypothetical protein